MAKDGAEQRKLAAIVFTDMVGSTQLKNELGDCEAVALIQRHHSLIREILSGFDEGEEIETAGDSFFILFARPSDAVKFALLVTSRLRDFEKEAHPISDRIGIHVGEVFMAAPKDSDETKQPSGIHVDTCARVMALGQANQILMTRFAFDSARSVLKREDIAGVGPLRWMNHGPYLLKGVEEPQEICEVAVQGQATGGRPISTEKAQRQVRTDEEPILGWRPAIGQMVPNAQWVLERKLGEGGFGEVWLGRHQKLKEQRVFKFCFRQDRVRSLKREVTIFRLMKERVGQHPNIVGVQDVHFDEPPFYLVMDYGAGQDLYKWCEARGGGDRVPLATKLELVAQIADALEAAHVAGVIHRDIKPSNILVSEPAIFNPPSSIPQSLVSNRRSPIAKLTDFGVGHVICEEILAGLTRGGFTRPTAVSASPDTGTLMYMAPELLAGKPASVRSDIYSLGVVLFQFEVGDFAAPVTTDWSKQIVDPVLREDLEKCFVGNPEERFASAGQLAANLRSVEERRTKLAEARAARAACERKAQRRRVAGRITAAATATVAFSLLGSYTYHTVRMDALHRKRVQEEALRADEAQKRIDEAEQRQRELQKQVDNALRELKQLRSSEPEKHALTNLSEEVAAKVATPLRISEGPSAMSAEQEQRYKTAMALAQAAFDRNDNASAAAQASVALEIRTNDPAATRLKSEAKSQLELAAHATAGEQKYETAMSQGRDALARKDYSVSISQAEVALAIKVKDPAALKLRSDAQGQQDLEDKALAQKRTLAAVPTTTQHEYELKAGVLYHVLNYVTWPSAQQTSQSETIKIGILGENQPATMISSLIDGRTILGKKVVVTNVTTSAECQTCQVVFIGAAEEPLLSQILRDLKDQPVLTVGDTLGFANRGVMVNMNAGKNRIELEINLASAGRNGLSFSSQLLKVAKIVDDSHGAAQ